MEGNKREMANSNTLCKHSSVNWEESHDNEQQNISLRAQGHFIKQVPTSECMDRSRCPCRPNLFSTELTCIWKCLGISHSVHLYLGQVIKTVWLSEGQAISDLQRLKIHSSAQTYALNSPIATKGPCSSVEISSSMGFHTSELYFYPHWGPKYLCIYTLAVKQQSDPLWQYDHNLTWQMQLSASLKVNYNYAPLAKSWALSNNKTNGCLPRVVFSALYFLTCFPTINLSSCWTNFHCKRQKAGRITPVNFTLVKCGPAQRKGSRGATSLPGPAAKSCVKELK